MGPCSVPASRAAIWDANAPHTRVAGSSGPTRLNVLVTTTLTSARAAASARRDWAHFETPYAPTGRRAACSSIGCSEAGARPYSADEPGITTPVADPA